MPQVFQKDCKINVIEYGCAWKPSLSLDDVKAAVSGFFKKYL